MCKPCYLGLILTVYLKMKDEITVLKLFVFILCLLFVCFYCLLFVLAVRGACWCNENSRRVLDGLHQWSSSGRGSDWSASSVIRHRRPLRTVCRGEDHKCKFKLILHRWPHVPRHEYSATIPCALWWKCTDIRRQIDCFSHAPLRGIHQVNGVYQPSPSSKRVVPSYCRGDYW